MVTHVVPRRLCYQHDETEQLMRGPKQNAMDVISPVERQERLRSQKRIVGNVAANRKIRADSDVCTDGQEGVDLGEQVQQGCMQLAAVSGPQLE